MTTSGKFITPVLETLLGGFDDHIGVEPMCDGVYIRDEFEECEANLQFFLISQACVSAAPEKNE